MDWALRLAAGSFLRAEAKRPALGRLVGLEPFVQLPVRHLQGRASAARASGSVSGVPGRAEDLDHLVERLEPRLIARPRAVHEPDDVACQAQRSRLGARPRSTLGSAIEAASFTSVVGIGIGLSPPVASPSIAAARRLACRPRPDRCRPGPARNGRATSSESMASVRR